MDVHIRSMKQEDVETCGLICYNAFKHSAERHNFPPDHPSPAFSIQLAQSYFANPQIFSIVAEHDDKVIGSNYLTEYDVVRAVGPLTIDSTVQSEGAGRQLMQAVIERGTEANSIRLVQDAFDQASLSLYTSLGFDVKEPLVVIEGTVKADVPTNIEIRSLREQNLAECAELSRSVHGVDRTGDLKNTPSLTAFVAVRDDRIIAYASAPHFWASNHAVAQSEADMQALLAGVGNQSGDRPLSLLLPTRQSQLFRWCLDQGMRVIKPATLMAMGKYQEPHGCYLPSVGY